MSTESETTWAKEKQELTPHSGLWGWAIRRESGVFVAWAKEEIDADLILSDHNSGAEVAFYVSALESEIARAKSHR
jgi:hypothetical protein